MGVNGLDNWLTTSRAKRVGVVEEDGNGRFNRAEREGLAVGVFGVGDKWNGEAQLAGQFCGCCWAVFYVNAVCGRWLVGGEGDVVANGVGEWDYERLVQSWLRAAKYGSGWVESCGLGFF